MGALFRWIGTAFGVLVLVGVVFGILMEVGVVPSDRVLQGKDIPADQYQVLKTEGIIEDGEVVEYFYSEGLLSVREGGSILTDKRVIAYEKNNDEGIELYQIFHEDISSIEMTQEGDTLNFAVYTVNGEQDGDWLDLWLPHEYGDGEKFAAAVRAKIQ
jgi:hypothetical protein